MRFSDVISLVFIDIPSKISDAFDAFFQTIFKVIGWVVSWAVLIGVGWCVFGPGVWLASELLKTVFHKPVPEYWQFLISAYLTIWFVLKKD